MSESSPTPAIREFLADQVHRLEPFEFVTVGSPAAPFVVVEIYRSGDGDFEVWVPPRAPVTPLPVPTRAKLRDRGFRSRDASNPLIPWIASAAGCDDAIGVAVVVLGDVFNVEFGDSLNLVHGSHRAEHEAVERLTDLRRNIEVVLADMLGRTPEQDADGDYIYPMEHVNVVVAPRVIPDAIALVRVFAITNADVTITPDLGMLLARLNFGLMFGRFALDAEHRAIWFDETVLGDDVTDQQLRYTIEMVAHTAAEWTGRLQHMFGGRTQRDIVPPADGATTKPGTGGYL